MKRSPHSVSKWFFVACGIWLIGLGGYFMLVRPPLLPEDFRYLGTSAVPLGLHGTGIALRCADLLTVATMSWTNFALDSDFKWLLLAPAVAWLFGLVSYGAGRRAEHAIEAASQANAGTPK